MAEKKKTSKIHTWKPKDYQVIVERDGKLFICHFDRIFGHKDKLSVYDRFLIGKESYINQLDIITSYTNFFINNYDYENELVTAYLKIKFALDKNKMFGPENMMGYISFLYETMFTETMVEKIVTMVEENYLDDIESDADDKKRYLKNEKKHLESLEFTNQHIKVLLEISFGMKIMSPVLFHYIQINSMRIEKDSDIIYLFYKRLFTLFGYGNTYELYDTSKVEYDPSIRKERYLLVKEGISKDEFESAIFELGDKVQEVLKDDVKYWYFTNEEGNLCYYQRSPINMYSKLYVYVKAKVLESNANNQTIFAQREIFGTDVFSVIHHFVRKVLISENVVKYKFNEVWDKKLKRYRENIVGFNKTIDLMWQNRVIYFENLSNCWKLLRA